MTPLEKEIQADIVTLLETVGAAVYRIGTTRKKGDHQGTMQTAWNSRPGDVCDHAFEFGQGPAQLVQLWIEVKRPGGRMQRCARLTFA